jgi:hypothetical protein
MQNKSQKPQGEPEFRLKMPKRYKERRKISRSQDIFYQCVLGLNALAWLLLAGSLIVFHYARPEFIAGVQNYWGVEGRDFWSQSHLESLLILLQGCLGLSLIVFVLRAKRNRRKSDPFAINLLVLCLISTLSLATLYVSL